MKCDLSSAWKKEISVKEWHAKEAAKKDAIAVMYLKQKEEITRLSKEGWVFKCEEWIHPHNSTHNLEAIFKSPRMKHFCWYSHDTDFAKAEARSLAACNGPRVGALATKVIEDALYDYYLANPNSTELPKLEISIIYDKADKVSCVVA